MAETDADKPTRDEPPKGAGYTPPPVARGTRRVIGQTMAPSSTDAFATPSDAPKSDEPQVFMGPEPAIFGGVNPIGGAAGVSPALPPDPTAVPLQEPVADAEDDEMTPGPLFSGAPKTVIINILRSSALLVLMFLLVGALATWIVIQAIPAEVYVSTIVRLKERPPLTEAEAQAQQFELNGLLRTYPVRAAAKALLPARAPKLTAGFLDSGVLFQEGDAITWLDARQIVLKVDTDRPKDDQVRLGLAAEGFLQVLRDREALLKERKQKLTNLELHLQKLKEQESELQPDPQHRGSKDDPDADFRKALKLRMDAAEGEIAKERRTIEIWPYADSVDEAGVKVSDNRPFRRRIINITWIALAGIFGAAIVMNRMRIRREAQAKRLRRRPRVQQQAPDSKGLAPDSPRQNI